jgi:phasin family protein
MQQYCIAQFPVQIKKGTTMPYQAFEDISKKLRKTGLERAKRVGAVNAQIWNQLIEQQLATAALALGAGVKQIRLLGQAQGPSDVLAGQAQLVQEYLEKVGEQVRRTVSAVTDLQREWAGLLQGEMMPSVAWTTPASAAATHAAVRAAQTPASASTRGQPLKG